MKEGIQQTRGSVTILPANRSLQSPDTTKQLEPLAWPPAPKLEVGNQEFALPGYIILSACQPFKNKSRLTVSSNAIKEFLVRT